MTQPAAATTGGESVPIIVVPLDGTPVAQGVLPIARALAELERAAVHVVHFVDGDPPPPRELPARLGLPAHALAGLVVDGARGDPRVAIVEWAARSRSAMIVMRAHSGAASRRGLGPVAEAVLRASSCPLLLVPVGRERERFLLRQMLIPLDGTPEMVLGVRPALDLARRAGAALIALHVATDEPSQQPGTLCPPTYVDQPQHEWPAWSHEFLDRIAGLTALPIETELRLFLARGAPGTEAVRVAVERAVDLIAVAWRGCFDGGRAVTIKGLIEYAPCPILIYRCH